MAYVTVKVSGNAPKYEVWVAYEPGDSGAYPNNTKQEVEANSSGGAEASFNVPDQNGNAYARPAGSSYSPQSGSYYASGGTVYIHCY